MTDKNKIITDDEEHILGLIEKARRGETVRMIGIGRSMRPLLEDRRDYIDLIAVKDDTEIKKNDVIFYKSLDGLYVLHRIISVAENGYFPNGDANLCLEPLLDRKNIYLKAIGFIRKGKYISICSIRYRLYSGIWTGLFSHRAFLLRWDGRIRKIRSLVRRWSGS